MINLPLINKNMKQELIEFIAKRTHLQANEINSELRLAKDIGFYGLDSLQFFDDFFKEFHIQNREDFDIHLYIDGGQDFEPQPLNFIRNLFSKRYNHPDVTLGHLEKVIEKGKWINEE